jgi:predicted porin
MKKHLIAAAVAAAVAAPAMAQSNVTVYGILDAGYNSESVKTAAGVETTKAKLATGGELATSRFGVRGTEDLGGGLTAGFQLEGAIGGGAFDFANRHQFLTLSGSFGSILVGKTDSMYKSVFDAFDAGFSNNVVGAADGLVASALQGTDSKNPVGLRVTTARYTTPSFSGFTASIGLSKDTTEVTGAADLEAESGEEYGLRYSAGNFAAALAFRDVENGQGVSKRDDKSLGLGASYNFGVATVYGQYFDHENKVGATKTDEKIYAIGVRVPVGATTLFASITNGETKVAGVKRDMEGYQIGAVYALSKRTSAYAIYGDQEVDKSATTKSTADEFAIGIRHSF